MTTAQHICLSVHSLWHARSTTWYRTHYMSTCTCPPLCSSRMLSRENCNLHSPPGFTLKRGGIVNKQSLTSESRPQETPAYRGERNVSAWRKPNESRLPVLRHQINFTLPHLPATVMSLIHLFLCSHGNSAAWSCSFFYICLSLSFHGPPPLQTPIKPAHLLHLRGTVTPQASQASSPLFSSITLWSGWKKKQVGGYKTQKEEAPGFTSCRVHALKSLWSKRHTFFKTTHKDRNGRQRQLPEKGG